MRPLTPDRRTREVPCFSCLLLLVACAPTPEPQHAKSDVLSEPERAPHFANSNPPELQDSSPEKPRAQTETIAPEPETKPTPAETGAAWVAEHCTPQTYPVEECEARCSEGAGRVRCESECEQFEVYASCPMMECPEGTDPNWIASHYQATCRRQAREIYTGPWQPQKPKPYYRVGQ